MALFLMILAIGCSRVSVMARFADTCIYWSLDDYLDLTSSQKSSFKASIATALQDVKAEIVPIFVKHLKDVKVQLENHFPQTPEEAKAFVDEQKLVVEKNVQLLISKVLPRFRSAFESLGSENWVSLKKEFEKQNAKILKPKDQCADKYQERLEDWIGSLAKSQIQNIEEYCEKSKWNAELRVKNRIHLLSEFEKQAGISAGNFSGLKVWEALSTWLQKMPELELPEYRLMRTERQESLLESLQKVLLSLSPEQKKRLLENLRLKAQDIESLVPKKAAG